MRPGTTVLVRTLVAEARGGLTADEITQSKATRLNKLPFEVDTAGKRLDLAIRQFMTGTDRVPATRAMAQLPDSAVNEAFIGRIRPEDLAVVVVGTAPVLKEAMEKAFGGGGSRAVRVALTACREPGEPARHVGSSFRTA